MVVRREGALGRSNVGSVWVKGQHEFLAVA
jgi:hypothetical protein